MPHARHLIPNWKQHLLYHHWIQNSVQSTNVHPQHSVDQVALLEHRFHPVETLRPQHPAKHLALLDQFALFKHFVERCMQLPFVV